MFTVQQLLNINNFDKLIEKPTKKKVKLVFKRAVRQSKEVTFSKILDKQEKKKRKVFKRAGYRNYSEYIKSRTWRKRKQKYYLNNGKYCCVCKTVDNVTLHHKYYGDYGKESDSDLICLCWFHHSELHKAIGNTKKDMRKETNKFLEEMKRFQISYNRNKSEFNSVDNST